MALEVPTFLVRYGANRMRDDTLTPNGLAQSERARDVLLSEGLGHLSLVLTAGGPPAIHTARIIRDGLGATLIESPVIAHAGNDPEDVADLDALLEEVVGAAEVDVDRVDGLVVVTRAQLIAAAQGIPPEEAKDAVPYGTVYQYEAGTWPGQIAA
jgi:hypothetical protein